MQETLPPAHSDGHRAHLFDRLRSAAGQFTRGQGKVADFISRHPDEAAFLTAAALARRVGASESAVVRFAQSLGFDGYPEFRASMRGIVREKLGTVEMLQRSSRALEDGSGVMPLVAKLDADLCAQTASANQWATVSRVIGLLPTTRHIYVTGQRTSFPFAHYLALCLNQVLGNARVLGSSAADTFDQLAHLGRRDLLIAFSFPRYMNATITALQVARGRGATTVVVTDSQLSPASRAAHHTLVVASGTLSFVRSQAGTLTVINTLLAGLSLRAKQRSMRALAAIDDLLYEHHMIESDETPSARCKRNGSEPGKERS
jgi:DNA-binding MurR/RpiR family transcriptional regulator